MTAPDARALLDELEKLRGEATPGTWMRWTAPDVTAIAAAERATVSGVPVNPARWIVSGASGLDPADAAAIVAAVNALPTLVAAVRAVEALADELEREAFGDGKGTIHAAGALYANRLRSTVAAAMTPEGETTP